VEKSQRYLLRAYLSSLLSLCLVTVDSLDGWALSAGSRVAITNKQP